MPHWYCASCGFGPHDPDLYDSCIECDARKPSARHRFAQPTGICDYHSRQNADSANTLFEAYATAGNHST